jgi:hypothetical protein
MTARTSTLTRALAAFAVAAASLVVAPPSLSAPSDARAASPAAGGLGRGPGGSTAPTISIPGFLLDNGRYTTFQVPGAATETLSGGIDDRGRIVGEYNDERGEHGFLRDARGRLTSFDVPGALATVATRVNNRGQIVGAYSEVSRNLKAPDSMPRGFLLDDGRLTRIDVPGAVFTQAIGINEHGQVVGDYVDEDGDVPRFPVAEGPVQNDRRPRLCRNRRVRHQQPRSDGRHLWRC